MALIYIFRKRKKKGTCQASSYVALQVPYVTILLFSLRRFLLYLLSLLLISSDARSFLQRIFFISSLVCRSFWYLLSKIFIFSMLAPDTAKYLFYLATFSR